MTHLNSTAFGLAFGLLWALGVAFLSITAMYFGYGTEWVDLMGTVYLGAAGTWQGVLLGTVWAFADGFIGGYLLAWLYNRFS
ncbi:hypothetical protein COY07_06190 [Candidatus Peregrinibacteria bacterium CG_4_10_14_0_2_um_filter_43_11]|nr:MAG: hypothetical protein COY07_06190 [Candidatus Peregrinibacteria bacterium CG_4_10_14_0_2_um_filter_43_11]